MSSQIGFDSDCIDRRLSGPGAGQIDKDRFSQVESDRQKLVNLYKKFVLVQPPHMTDREIIPNVPGWVRWNKTADADEDIVTGKRLEKDVIYPSFADIGIMDCFLCSLYF